MLRVPFVNLSAQYQNIKIEIQKAMDDVLSSGNYVQGHYVTTFETEFAKYMGTKFAAGVANGTDALILSLRAIGVGPGDEVITAPNSFLASASCIALVNATPVFVDVREDYNIDPERIEEAVTKKTKAIIPVHLTGRPADLDGVLAVARKHGLKVIEDAAQAVGARYKGRGVGDYGITGCFSFHPLKNLNAYGDGGIITTNSEEIIHYLNKARNHGMRNRDECEFWSVNSRLDALQSAVLSVKLKHLNTWTEKRRANATFYAQRLGAYVTVPKEKEYEYSVYQTFMIQADNRDELKNFLEKKGIETKIHYPIPIHAQEAANKIRINMENFPNTVRLAKRILSLPIYPELTQEQLDYTAQSISSFYS